MQKQIINLEKITVIFGYGLFGLYVTLLTINTVLPWLTLLSISLAKHFNITVFTVSLVAGALMPVLLSYLLGERATHTKNRLTRHFSGILFGATAYWITLCVSLLGSDIIGWLRSIFPEPWPIVMNSCWQIAMTITIMAIIAYAYVRRKKNASLLEYRPYQITLFGSAIAPSVYTITYAQNSNLLISSLLTFGIPVALVAMSYIVLAKSSFTRSARLTLSFISMSFALMSAHIASTALSIAVPYNNLPFATLLIGTIVMTTYLLLLRRG